MADWSFPLNVVTCSAASVWETLWHHHTPVPPAGRDSPTANTTPFTSDHHGIAVTSHTWAAAVLQWCHQWHHQMFFFFFSKTLFYPDRCTVLMIDYWLVSSDVSLIKCVSFNKSLLFKSVCLQNNNRWVREVTWHYQSSCVSVSHRCVSPHLSLLVLACLCPGSTDPCAATMQLWRITARKQTERALFSPKHVVLCLFLVLTHPDWFSRTLWSIN